MEAKQEKVKMHLDQLYLTVTDGISMMRNRIRALAEANERLTNENLMLRNRLEKHKKGKKQSP